MKRERIKQLIKLVTLLTLFIFPPLNLIYFNSSLELNEKIQLFWIYVVSLGIITQLIKDDILHFLSPPVFKITADEKPEHFHEAEVLNEKERRSEKQAWFGIRLENVGIANAKNVQVFFRGIESKVGSEDIIDDFYAYGAIPLTRSWSDGDKSIKILPPGVSIRWDVCMISDKHKNFINFHFFRTPNKIAKIKCMPNKDSIFRFRITAIADNANKEETVKVIFKGNYNDGFGAEVEKQKLCNCGVFPRFRRKETREKEKMSIL